MNHTIFGLKKKTAFGLISSLISMSLMNSALAEPKTINERQKNQWERIQQGTSTRQLTHDERVEVRQDQRDIRNFERGARFDGLSDAERDAIQAKLNAASQRIYELKHNSEHGRNVNERQAYQRDRIADGVASGELNRDEAKELREERRDVNEFEQGARVDGLTTEERLAIQRRLNELSGDIYDLKHNDVVRQPAGASESTAGEAH